MPKISVIAQLRRKRPTDTVASIIIRGYYNRKPVASISTGYKIPVACWDPIDRRVLTTHENHQLLNAAIEGRILDIQKKLLQKEISGHQVNRQHIYKAVKGINESRDFLEFCRQRIREDYANPDTRRSYITEVDNLSRFRPALSFADIDFQFLNQYNNYLRDELKNDQNTIWKKFKFIRTMINKAIRTGEAIYNPFNEFKMQGYQNRPRKCLSIADCRKIEQEFIDKAQPEIIRNVAIYFLLMAYTGMRFRDAIGFDPKEHVKDGRVVMRYQKTGTYVNNPVHQKLGKIIKLVEGKKFKITNQTMNQYLKVIRAFCGISIPLTTHIGRHTLGGMLAELQVSESEAQIILGHKDRRSTKVYYHVPQKNINSAVMKLDTL